MPTTTNGVSYTITDTTLASGSTGRVCVPAGQDVAADAPIFLYAHGNNGNYKSFSEAVSYAAFRDVVIGEFKMTVVEATAGVSAVDTGANSYGNDFARATYEQALAFADSLLADPGQVVVAGGSAGGMNASWLAAQASFLSSRIAGLLLHRAVVNAYVWRTGNEKGLGSTPPSPYDPEWQKAQLGVFVAPYGLASSSQGDYDGSVIPSRDPLLFADADWLRVPRVLLLDGSIDSTVPPYWHGTKLYDDRLSGLLGALAVDNVTPGADHGSVAPTTFAETGALRTFLTAAVGVVIPPVEATDRSSRTARHMALI